MFRIGSNKFYHFRNFADDFSIEINCFWLANQIDEPQLSGKEIELTQIRFKQLEAQLGIRVNCIITIFFIIWSINKYVFLFSFNND